MTLYSQSDQFLGSAELVNGRVRLAGRLASFDRPLREYGSDEPVEPREGERYLRVLAQSFRTPYVRVVTE